MHLPWQGRGGTSGSRKLFKTIVQDNYPHFVRILFDLHLQKKTCKHVDHVCKHVDLNMSTMIYCFGGFVHHSRRPWAWAANRLRTYSGTFS